MKAFIFAAGFGKRLKPLTNKTPKALIEVQGKTLLEHSINKLKSEGFNDIIINIYYLGNQIIDFFNNRSFDDINITISNERGMLLDTGGALKKASWFFDQKEPFVIYNVDVISDINLKNMLDFHLKSNALATLAVRTRESSRYLLFDKKNDLTGWENTKTGERIISSVPGKKHVRQAFSGIHIVDPGIFKYFPSDNVFPIMELYLSLIEHRTIKGYNHDNTFWFDIGTPEKLDRTRKYFK